VFFGSCNDTKFLQDRTGNRRFWPILGVKFDTEALQRDRDQLWAEAAAAEAADESIRLGQELWSVAETVQSESLEVEPWTEALATALGDFEGKIRSTDIWSILDIEVKNRKSADDNRMGAAIRELGWERKQLRYGHGPEWGYVKGKSAAQVHVWRDRRTGTLFVYQGCVLRKILSGQAVKQELDHDVSPTDFGEDDGYGGERWSGPKFRDW
jgi:hypothetical protein